MRCLLISDIHSNLAAFKAVLDDAKGRYDKVWCLGDIVGYGPSPNECIQLLASLDHLCIAGNHDWAVLGKLDVDDFNPDARHVSLWTRSALTEGNQRYIESLPVALVQAEHFTLAHGSPRHPIWEYILYPAVAQVNFGHFSTRYCLVGHTHSPVIFYAPNETNGICQAQVPSTNGPGPLGNRRLILNPGSVGQPRDGDPRASYGILDLDTLTFEYRRIPYPIADVQGQMEALGFPTRLVNRLSFGW
ncbi:MAG: metallophosphoesterase family protein [Anaerolineales bacterium]|nr:MAG: metallophosphoesterase family protein [Anaerolineales bacterium]